MSMVFDARRPLFNDGHDVWIVCLLNCFVSEKNGVAFTFELCVFYLSMWVFLFFLNHTYQDQNEQMNTPIRAFFSLPLKGKLLAFYSWDFVRQIDLCS